MARIEWTRILVILTVWLGCQRGPEQGSEAVSLQSFDAPDRTLVDRLATTLADSIFGVHGVRYTPQQSSELYLAGGDATDWLYGETGAPSFTIELRPRSSIPGFILPEGEIQPTFEENLPAALLLIQWVQSVARPTTTL